MRPALLLLLLALLALCGRAEAVRRRRGRRTRRGGRTKESLPAEVRVEESLELATGGHGGRRKKKGLIGKRRRHRRKRHRGRRRRKGRRGGVARRRGRGHGHKAKKHKGHRHQGHRHKGKSHHKKGHNHKRHHGRRRHGKRQHRRRPIRIRIGRRKGHGRKKLDIRRAVPKEMLQQPKPAQLPAAPPCNVDALKLILEEIKRARQRQAVRTCVRPLRLVCPARAEERTCRRRLRQSVCVCPRRGAHPCVPRGCRRPLPTCPVRYRRKMAGCRCPCASSGRALREWHRRHAARKGRRGLRRSGRRRRGRRRGKRLGWRIRRYLRRRAMRRKMRQMKRRRARLQSERQSGRGVGLNRRGMASRGPNGKTGMLLGGNGSAKVHSQRGGRIGRQRGGIRFRRMFGRRGRGHGKRHRGRGRHRRGRHRRHRRRRHRNAPAGASPRVLLGNLLPPMRETTTSWRPCNCPPGPVQPYTTHCGHCGDPLAVIHPGRTTSTIPPRPISTPNPSHCRDATVTVSTCTACRRPGVFLVDEWRSVSQTACNACPAPCSVPAPRCVTEYDVYGVPTRTRVTTPTWPVVRNTEDARDRRCGCVRRKRRACPPETDYAGPPVTWHTALRNGARNDNMPVPFLGTDLDATSTGLTQPTAAIMSSDGGSIGTGSTATSGSAVSIVTTTVVSVSSYSIPGGSAAAASGSSPRGAAVLPMNNPLAFLSPAVASHAAPGAAPGAAGSGAAQAYLAAAGFSPAAIASLLSPPQSSLLSALPGASVAASLPTTRPAVPFGGTATVASVPVPVQTTAAPSAPGAAYGIPYGGAEAARLPAGLPPSPYVGPVNSVVPLGISVATPQRIPIALEPVYDADTPS